ncbi:MAG TPA: M20/M25/M40 family metallo-hydrolase [Rectinemataceae bacterium]
MQDTPPLADARALAIAMTKAASVTGSPGEKAFPAFLRSILAAMPYFEEHPRDLFLDPIPGDPVGRSNLFALARGKGKACVVLTGHYDVVQTAAYGSLEPLAFDPEALCERLKADLEGLERKADDASFPGAARDASISRLKADLESGEFLPGRGLLDMKSGLAAGIAVLSRFASGKARDGSMLFMAVADEEGSSLGMKAALPRLQALMAERRMEIAAVFNLDAAVDQGSGELGRALFTGSVGKTLPFVYFLGKSAHAGSPFEGINPALMAAEFARALECDPEAFKERHANPGERPAPPTILYMRENRESYDVTMPRTVFCALNALSQETPPESILDEVSRLAADAMDRAVSILRERASTYSRMISGHFTPRISAPRSLLFDEFLELAERGWREVRGRKSGEAEADQRTEGGSEAGRGQALSRARKRAASLHPEDKVLQTMDILDELLPFTGIEGPAAVAGFAPPYYARAELDGSRHAAFISKIRAVLSSYAQEGNKPLRIRPFFPGISDMSLLSPAEGAGERSFVRTQSPVADSSSDESAGLALGCPVLNLGPWGREYHQAGERVNADYAFRELPEILYRLCAAALVKGDRDRG